MSGNKVKIFTVLLLMIAVVSGCKDVLPPKKSSPETDDAVRRLSYKDPPGNAKKVMELARDFARGVKSAKELGIEFDKLSDPQIQQLAEKLDGDDNFLHFLTRGMASARVVQIAEKFFNKIHPSVVAKQMSAKSGGKTAFDTIRDLANRDASEEVAERIKLLAQLVVADPKLVNELKDRTSGNFDAVEFASVADAIDVAKISGIAQVMQDDNIKAWMTWTTSNPADVNEMYERLTTNFVKLYAHGGSSKQALMRNFLLQKFYALDTALEVAGGATEMLMHFMGKLADLGLQNGLGDDVYQLPKNPAAGGHHSGSLLYVLSKRVGEDLLLGGGLNFRILKEVSNIVKENLGSAYNNHVTVETFGLPVPETIFAGLQALPREERYVKSALNLAISPSDVYQEIRLLATKVNLADRKVSKDLRLLLEDYKRDNTNLDPIIDLAVPAADNGVGALRTADKFIHILARLVTDDKLLDLLQYLTANITVPATALGENNPAGRSALWILTKAGRNPLIIGAEHDDIVKLVLTKTLAHGNAADLTKAFSDMDPTAFPVLASFVYENRTHAFQAGLTIVSVFVAEYGRHPAGSAEQQALVERLIEAALTADGIGNANRGVAGIISLDFLPLLAIQAVGYNLFSKAARVGNNNTLLYDIMIHAAAIKMEADGMTKDQALDALDDKIAGVAVLAPFHGALNQAEVSALAQAFKAKLTSAPGAWYNLARDNVNSMGGNRAGWQLLRFTVPELIALAPIAAEATARAPNYLDY